MHESSFRGSEGTVAYRRWDPAGTPTHIVQIVHGYAEHGGRYAHVAEALNAEGAVVYADDHLGHGRSDGERALITNFDHVVDDLIALMDIAQADNPGLPHFFVGHSMGGLLSARVGQRVPERVSGIAFCGSVIGDWDWARTVLEEPELPEVEFDPLAISRDPAVGADYASDPLVYHGQYKRGLLEAEVVALDAFAENIDRLTMPVLYMHGTSDPFVPYERSLQAVRDMPTDDLTTHIFEDGRHEVLNDINKDEVIGHLKEWLRSHL